LERVLVTGASGPIGAALLPYLESQGARIIRLVRGPARGPDQVRWDPGQALEPSAVSGCEVVIHLAGESVFGRWTAARKKAILESRLQGTTTVARAMGAADVRPRVFICASAIGFYGNGGDRVLTEESPSGNDFPSEVCRVWEGASRIAADAGIRTVNLRIGLVLSPKGGALGMMLPAFKLGLGGRLGSGKQWSSWIHVDDIVGAVHHLIQTESVSGAVNFVSPAPVTNAEFTKTLASVLRRPAILPVPAFAARLAFGEMADQLLLSGQRVLPAKLQASGYSFRFSELRPALEELLE
jgi:uncharacterized protein (TIGR01777 family)